MTISVVIPTYNSARFIGRTLESVFRQTLAPDEILVLDDGSTDETLSLLQSYGKRITVLQQKNRGVAAARNALFRGASGDFIAFLDHDDIWHPRYLEIQSHAFRNHREGVAFFTGHHNFYGYGGFEWEGEPSAPDGTVETLSQLAFFETYNKAPGRFGSMSFLCIPRHQLERFGAKPFCEQINGADDFYLCNLFPLFGPVIYRSLPLVAYRITPEAQSASPMRNYQRAVVAFELLEERYRRSARPDLLRAFQRAFATKRRCYARTLLGAGLAREARGQCLTSMCATIDPASVAKSSALWLASYLPSRWLPQWNATVHGGTAPVPR